MSATYATISDLRAELLRPKRELGTPAWRAKMLHFVPDLPTVKDRVAYLAEKVKGLGVLDLGAGDGTLSKALQASAATYWAIDKTTVPAWAAQGAVVDLDDEPSRLPVYEGVEVIVAGELLEHLANPGRFLQALGVCYPNRDLWLTVPHAGSYQAVDDTHEMVNPDHVAWYSYTTLTTLLTRYGYPMTLARWSNGQAHVAEGLIVLTHTPGSREH
jgi:hypothetical protein